MVSWFCGSIIVIYACLTEVREKAKNLEALVKDKERVKEERLRAKKVNCL